MRPHTHQQPRRPDKPARQLAEDQRKALQQRLLAQHDERKGDRGIQLAAAAAISSDHIFENTQPPLQ